MNFLLALALFYIWHILGVTIGYHRLLSHRSFRCSKLVEYFWALPAYLAFEGSPIWWVTMHRAHHKYTDQDGDPHSPVRGWKHAYFGWIFDSGYQNGICPHKQAPDMVSDQLYAFLEQNGRWHRAHTLAVAIGLAFRILLLALFGWQIALASLIAGITVQQIPLLLNYVCHIPALGYRSYHMHDDSVNVWWVALLTAGEGWHNNHHAFPGSAKSGLKQWEIDPSWMAIKLMKKLGLATSVNQAEPHAVQQKQQFNRSRGHYVATKQSNSTSKATRRRSFVSL